MERQPTDEGLERIRAEDYGQTGALSKAAVLQHIFKRGRSALQMLYEASIYARDVNHSLWDFSLEMCFLKEGGLAPSDLRWLLCKGLVDQAGEIDSGDLKTRCFQAAGSLSFSPNSCFVLTEEGQSFVRDSLSGMFVPSDEPIVPSANFRMPDSEWLSVKPYWDRDRQELRVGQMVVKQFKVPAPNQEIVLAAFHEENWPVRIDDPLPPRGELEPKRRLHDTINSLNRNQKSELLRFLGGWKRTGSPLGVRTTDYRADPVSLQALNPGTRQLSLEFHHIFGRQPEGQRLQKWVLTNDISIPNSAGVTFMPQAPIRELGWQPDMPDWRDLTVNTARVAGLMGDLTPLGNRPGKISWDQFCQDVEPDWEVPSSTRVCVDLLEYCERRVSGNALHLSGRFVHRTAARFAQTHGGNPLSLRLVWKSIVRFGAPTANVWPGPEESAKLDPDAFAYSMARNYSNLTYVRLDARSQSTSVTLETIRCFLAAGFTFVLGIPHFSSISSDGEIGFPTTYDTACGGQAVLVIGYDDFYRVRSDRGCFRVRGCWGNDWGDRGFGWLPYSYVRKQLAIDLWTVLNPQWLASGEFRRPIR